MREGNVKEKRSCFLKDAYSLGTRKKWRFVLEDFKLYILHINNVEYQGLSEC